MKQGIQNTFEFAPMKKWGCYYLCLCEWAVRTGAKEPTAAELIAMSKIAIAKKYLDEEFEVLKPAELLHLVGGQLFKKVEWVPADKIAKTETIILCNKKIGHTHFTLQYNEEIWDPLDPARAGVADYRVDSGRRFS